MISFVLALYLGGVLLLDLLLGPKWPSYVYGWLKPAPKATDA